MGKRQGHGTCEVSRVTLDSSHLHLTYFGGNTATHLHEFISQLSMKSM